VSYLPVSDKKKTVETGRISPEVYLRID